MGREILTFQFGHYANHVGCHWWNLQENSFEYGGACNSGEEGTSLNTEICHDVLYREGVNRNRMATYTPRLLLVDLNGAFKHLSPSGELYPEPRVEISRQPDGSYTVNEEDLERLQKEMKKLPGGTGKMEVKPPEIGGGQKHELQVDLEKPDAAKILPTKDYNLPETVDSWADYLYTRFHPRTINVIRQYQHHREQHSLGTFQNGEQLWQTEQFREEFSERIRQYMEECDVLQGFQLLCDGCDGFAGLSSQCLEHLNDEYHKSSLVWPVFAPRNLLFEHSDDCMSDSIRVVNTAFTYVHLAQQASLFVPLSTRQEIWRHLGPSRDFGPHLNLREDNLYQSSAILAALLDTSSLEYRLKGGERGGSSSMFQFCRELNNYGRIMASASMVLPFPLHSGEDLIDCLNRMPRLPLTPLTPNCCPVAKDSYVTERLCVRGVAKDRLKRPRDTATREQMEMAAYRCESISEMFQMYMKCVMYETSRSHVTTIQKPLNTKLPFPVEMFKVEGMFKVAEDPRKLESLPCLSAIQSYEGLGSSLASLHQEAKRVKLARFPRFRDSGLEDDDFKEMLEDLLVFSENYDNKYDL